MTQWIAVAAGLLLAANCQASSQAAVDRILIAGDSTAADYPAERIGQIGWGQALPYYLSDHTTVLNLAVSGRSTKSFVDEGKWGALLDQVQPGDLVLISFGHNDSRDDAPERYAPAMGAYKSNLIGFVDDVEAAGGQAIIVWPAARRLWEGPAMVETHGVYRLAAEQAAAESGVDFIDLSNLSLSYFEKIGQEETKTDFLWITRPKWQSDEVETLEDNTHFSFIGGCGVARLIAIELNQQAGVETVSTNAGADDEPRPASVVDCAEAVEEERKAADGAQ